MAKSSKPKPAPKPTKVVTKKPTKQQPAEQADQSNQSQENTMPRAPYHAPENPGQQKPLTAPHPDDPDQPVHIPNPSAAAPLTQPYPEQTVDNIIDQISRQKQAGVEFVPPGAKSEDQRKGATTKVPTKAEKKAMLEQMAAAFGSTPGQIEQALRVSDPNMALVEETDEDPPAPVPADQHKGARTPIRLKADYWLKDNVKDQWPSSGVNRATAGSVVHLPIADARILIDGGKAERADPLPGEVG